MSLDEPAVKDLYRPESSRGLGQDESRASDNGRVPEPAMDVVRHHARTMGAAPAELTTAWVKGI